MAEGNLVPEVALAEEGTNKIHVFDAKVCYLFTIMSLRCTGITTRQYFDLKNNNRHARKINLI